MAVSGEALAPASSDAHAAPIVDAFIAGSAGAFDAHAQQVLRFCTRRCDQPSVAEDLMSVVFLEAWRCRQRAVAVDGSLRPWLYGIASNVLRNAARSKRRYAAALDRFHAANPEADTPDHADAVATEASVDGLRDEIIAAFTHLSAKERAVADLALVEGLPITAVAAVLGITASMAKSRLARARGRLRRLLRSSEPTDLFGLSGHQQNERPPAAPVGKAHAS